MMNERRRKRQILKVDHYDGQTIYSGRELYYELGGYLGGGAAGVVYEAFCARTKRHVAIKILNPVGYKLLPSSLLSRCIVAVRGKPLELTNTNAHGLANDDDDDDGLDDHHHNTSFARHRSGGNLTPGGSSRFATVETRMRLENVWWLIHPSTKQAVAAYEDPRTGALRELSLPQCIDVWGSELQVDDFHDDADRKFAQLEDATQDVQVKQQTLSIPKIPKKFIKFACTRRTIHREIANMSGLGAHENVLRLDEALELVQDSKCTTFLVLELAAGGELFDRIKLDCGTDEDTARRYFRQLISGVAFCHASGVCHRDLKPENLLLADNEEVSTLKIADFGLSAIFAMTEQGGGGQGSESSLGGQDAAATVQAIRRLRSVVGSPHYVAPEVLMDAGQGYDGAKADAWSIGVIVYAMLAGNLPFGKDLLKCLRYEKFKKWCYNTKYSDEDPADEVAFPTWFFPAQFSLEVKSLVTQLLYPDPTMRLSVEEAQRHAWVLGQRLARRTNYSENPEASPPSSSSSSSSMLHAPAPGNAPSPTIFRDMAVPGVTIHAVEHDHAPQQTMAPPSSTHQRWTPRNAAMSPGGQLNRMPLHARSPTAASMMLSSSSLGVPPSPQKAALRAHLMSSGYMPSVDETAPLSSGQTPVNSPRHSGHDQDDAQSMTTLQFAMDQSVASPSAGASPLKEVGRDDALERECQRSPSFTSPAPSPISVSSSSPSAVPSSDSPRESGVDSPQRSSRRRFTSPPIATGSHCSIQERNNYLHRRNSPPELFLSRFGKGFKFEAIQTAFEEISLEQADLSINLAITPAFRERASSSATCESGSRPKFASSSHSVPNTPLGGAASTSVSSSSSQSVSSSSSVVSAGAASPPSYQADLVARSTRFITTLPAQLVLSKIETILTTRPSPVPTRSEAGQPQQRVTIDWDKYQLDVSYGDVLTCTVQVFLFQRGVYLVEFRRGQVEIFQFKRFYEDIREKLSDGVDLSFNDARLRNTTTSGNDEENASPRQFPRKRNKSIGVHAELLR